MSNRPGAIVQTRMPTREVARGRERQADHAALRRRVGGLPDLAVEGGDRRGHHDGAALAALVGLVRGHRRGRQPQHVEGADQVDPHDGLERLERRRARPSSTVRSAQPMPAHETGEPQLAGALDRRLDLRLVGDVGLDEAAAQLLASAAPRSSFRSATVTRAPRAGELAGGRLARARRRRRPPGPLCTGSCNYSLSALDQERDPHQCAPLVQVVRRAGLSTPR